MSEAPAGQIVVSSVVTQTSETTAYTSLGPKQLKDIDDTWELHVVE
jgi:hypothetical protein